MSYLNALAFIVSGLITVGIAHYRPYAFWARADVCSLRSAIGAASTRGLIYAVGGLLWGVGLWLWLL